MGNLGWPVLAGPCRPLQAGHPCRALSLSGPAPVVGFCQVRVPGRCVDPCPGTSTEVSEGLVRSTIGGPLQRAPSVGPFFFFLGCFCCVMSEAWSDAGPAFACLPGWRACWLLTPSHPTSDRLHVAHWPPPSHRRQVLYASVHDAKQQTITGGARRRRQRESI